MDEFLKLSIRNAIRNDDKPADEFASLFSKNWIDIKKYLNVELVEELEDKFFDMASDAFEYAALFGMKLAIGVLNGTIQQTIEL